MLISLIKKFLLQVERNNLRRIDLAQAEYDRYEDSIDSALI